MVNDKGKLVWSTPLILFTLGHLATIFTTYGTMTYEMKSFNRSLNAVVSELKMTNEIVSTLKEDDIRYKMQQDYILNRIEKIESKIK